MKITEALAAEHATLLKRFAEVERVLPRLRSPAEVRAMAALVGGVLGDHVELESHLALLPLNHAAFQKRQLTRRAQDHQHIYEQLRQARRAPSCAKARRLLLAALRASRERFQDEERFLFPAIEQALKPGDLVALGKRFNSARQLEDENEDQASPDFRGNLVPGHGLVVSATPQFALRSPVAKARLAALRSNKGTHSAHLVATSSRKPKKHTFRIHVHAPNPLGSHDLVREAA